MANFQELQLKFLKSVNITVRKIKPFADSLHWTLESGHIRHSNIFLIDIIICIRNYNILRLSSIEFLLR